MPRNKILPVLAAAAFLITGFQKAAGQSGAAVINIIFTSDAHYGITRAKLAR